MLLNELKRIFETDRDVAQGVFGQLRNAVQGGESGSGEADANLRPLLEATMFKDPSRPKLTDLDANAAVAATVDKKEIDKIINAINGAKATVDKLHQAFKHRMKDDRALEAALGTTPGTWFDAMKNAARSPGLVDTSDVNSVRTADIEDLLKKPGNRADLIGSLMREAQGRTFIEERVSFIRGTLTPTGGIASTSAGPTAIKQIRTVVALLGLMHHNLEVLGAAVQRVKNNTAPAAPASRTTPPAAPVTP